MDKGQIQENIDNAVEVFRETLEKTYLENNRDFHGINIHKLEQVLTGKISYNRLNSGDLRICGNLPKDCFKDNVKGLPRKIDDYKIFPIVVTIFHKDVSDTMLSEMQKPKYKEAIRDKYLYKLHKGD